MSEMVRLLGYLALYAPGVAFCLAGVLGLARGYSYYVRGRRNAQAVLWHVLMPHMLRYLGFVLVGIQWLILVYFRGEISSVRLRLGPALVGGAFVALARLYEIYVLRGRLRRRS